MATSPPLRDESLRAALAEAFHWFDPGAFSDHLVSDVSGWWHSPALLASVGPALAALYADSSPTLVVSPEVTGFLVGPLVAVALGVGFAPAVKDGGDRRLVDRVTWARTPPDYRGRELRLGVRERQIRPSDRVLVVDDWVATGAQVRALYEVVAARGATAVGCAAIVDAAPPSLARSLRLRSLLTAADLG
ncbi:phosphoribosyltransferase family protein [Asanoa sp. WMMD1127]|uniref:phosphoribosyltransferase family protein n=1 Tax=Asanoa sp. WMMD1127 TaxID=3016107 RepID=UPI002416B0B0|nr:phosphoribosyltransferase family protein [Asanoa sp. WMMD1127]MDG4822273.1 phosphoribosyltransferase family protein [Asanoa sp. WMMD1127]